MTIEAFMDSFKAPIGLKFQGQVVLVAFTEYARIICTG